jgi:hypothetical protein
MNSSELGGAIRRDWNISLPLGFQEAAPTALKVAAIQALRIQALRATCWI